ncbi:MAG: rRNA maturation RNase YbeY [Sphingomicrobium sp.]
MLDIAIDADAEWDSSTDWQRLVRAAATSAIAESAFPQLATGPRKTELSVRLTSDAEVHALNAHWRGKDMATNVLSFPMAEPYELEAADDVADDDGPELLIGDVILARGVCDAEAAAKGVSLAQHATHLVVHGTLHLLGHDHDDEAAAADMERREVRALARLGIADPYAGSN